MTRILLPDLMPGSEFAVRIRSVNGELKSEWSIKQNFNTISDTTPPSVPTGVTWESIGDSFHAEWNAVNTNTGGRTIPITRYEIELVADGTTKIVSVSPTTGDKVTYDLSFEQNRALFGEPQPEVTFRVRAVDNKELKSSFTIVESASNPVPSAPANITTTGGVGVIDVEWEPPAGTTDNDIIGYNLYLGPTRIWFGDATRFTYTTATYTSQTFTVKAVDKFLQESTGVSDSATANSPFGIDSTPPDTPYNFDVTISDDPSNVTLTQNAVAEWNQEEDDTLAGYHIRYKISGTTNWSTIDVPSDAQPLTPSGGPDPTPEPYLVSANLTPNEDYDFELRSYDLSGNKSSWVALLSNAVTPVVEPTLTHSLVIQGGGYIESFGYTSGVGFHIDEDEIVIYDGLIKGQAISTGIIQSNLTGLDSDPLWYVDLDGDAVFQNLLVRGTSVVGSEGDEANSFIQSFNYSPGSAGWIIRADGMSEFRQVVAGSMNPEALGSGIISSDNTIELKGTLAAYGYDGSGDLTGVEVGMSSAGFYSKGPDSLGVITTYVEFPTETGKPNIISGTLNATTLTVSQSATFQQGDVAVPAMTLQTDSSFKLASTVAPPAAAPTVVVDWANQSPNFNSGEMYRGWHEGHDGKFYSTGLVIAAANTYQVNIRRFNATTAVAETEFAGPQWAYDPAYKRNISITLYGLVYVPGMAGGTNAYAVPYRVKYDNYSGGVTYTSTVRTVFVAFYNTSWGYLGQGTLYTWSDPQTSEFHSFGRDYVNNKLLWGYKRVSDNKFFSQSLNVTGSGLMSLNGSAVDHGTQMTWGSIIGYNSWDVGSNHYAWQDNYVGSTINGAGKTAINFFTAAAPSTPVTTLQFYQANNSDTLGGAWNSALSRFETLNQDGKRYIYYGNSNNWATGGPSASWNFKYTWWDSTGTNKETSASPAPAITPTMYKRARITVTTASIPYFSGVTDSPNRARVYRDLGSGYSYVGYIEQPGQSWSLAGTTISVSGSIGSGGASFGSATSPGKIYSDTGLLIDGSGGGTFVNITATGIVTRTGDPYFFGSITTGTSLTGGSAIDYPVVENVGSAYSSGVFTVPTGKGGLYHVIIAHKGNGSVGSIQVFLQKNNGTAGSPSWATHKYPPDRPSQTFGGWEQSIYIRLAAGEQIRVTPGSTFTTQSDSPAHNNFLQIRRVA